MVSHWPSKHQIASRVGKLVSDVPNQILDWKTSLLKLIQTLTLTRIRFIYICLSDPTIKSNYNIISDWIRSDRIFCPSYNCLQGNYLLDLVRVIEINFAYFLCFCNCSVNFLQMTSGNVCTTVLSNILHF